MKRASASSPKLLLVLAGGVLIALAMSIGWMTLRQPAGSTDSSARDTSFVAEIEKITDSLLRFLDGGNIGREEKNTAGAGVLQSSHHRRPARREAGLP